MMSRSIPSMTEWAHVNTSRLCLRNFDTISRILSSRFFPIFSTLEGSLSLTGRSIRSSMGPVVPSLSGDLGYMVSLRGPSLGGY